MATCDLPPTIHGKLRRKARLAQPKPGTSGCTTTTGGHLTESPSGGRVSTGPRSGSTKPNQSIKQTNTKTKHKQQIKTKPNQQQATLETNQQQATLKTNQQATPTTNRQATPTTNQNATNKLNNIKQLPKRRQNQSKQLTQESTTLCSADQQEAYNNQTNCRQCQQTTLNYTTR